MQVGIVAVVVECHLVCSWRYVGIAVDVLQACAPCEGILPDFSHATVEDDFCQFRTALKRAVADEGYRVGKCQGGQ